MPQLRPPSVSIGVTLEREFRSPWYDNILDGSVITARDVLGSMKGKIELAEYVVLHCATLFLIILVFGTLGSVAQFRLVSPELSACLLQPLHC